MNLGLREYDEEEDVVIAGAGLEDDDEEEASPSMPTSHVSPFGDADLRIHLNQTLIDSTRRLKEEQAVLRTRFEKMEESRTQVSQAVYEKVKADYAVKYRELAQSFTHKKSEIDAELEKLYEASREFSETLEKHRETLEEAKFRHFLGEYPDAQYKLVEKREEKDIISYEKVLGKLQGYVDQYQSLLGPEEEIPSLSGRKTAPASERVAPKKVAPRVEVKKPEVSQVVAIGIDLMEKTQLKDVKVEAPSVKEESMVSSLMKKTQSKIPAPQAKPVKEESIADILDSIPLESSGVSFKGKESEVVEEDLQADSEESDEVLPSGKLVMLETGGEAVSFTELAIDRPMSIGRLPTSDIILPSAKVSRKHAEIVIRDGEYVIVDLGSSNGLTVNGNRARECLLRNGDEIIIGRYKMRFEVAG